MWYSWNWRDLLEETWCRVVIMTCVNENTLSTHKCTAFHLSGGSSLMNPQSRIDTRRREHFNTSDTSGFDTRSHNSQISRAVVPESLTRIVALSAETGKLRFEKNILPLLVFKLLLIFTLIFLVRHKTSKPKWRNDRNSWHPEMIGLCLYQRKPGYTKSDDQH